MGTQRVLEGILSGVLPTGTSNPSHSNTNPYVNKLHKAAKEAALRNNDASSYFRLCNKYGFDDGDNSYKSQELFQRGIEEARRDALAGWHSADYVEFCQEAGISEDDCEAPELYQQGLVEIIAEKRRAERLRKEVLALERRVKREKRSASKASVFLDDVNNYGVNVYGSFAADADSKRELLLKHFPGRFGTGKRQDLDRYDDVQVGAMFRNVVNSYEERQKE